ncbi:tetratricopeptide repeat protein [Roseibium sp. RKSG952]|uniref:tetratricopeptide repeat protein n=1 Tax=Roseibium sp. RKSG952 TaxID=2529384 RepID=UPI0012BBAE34|nr:tetratricopeptide repeat protein [Roseibium sp. RKSG952]MTH99564.1 tetratricopeptide repeat protein [Roseibium sp. RKSG952]
MSVARTLSLIAALTVSGLAQAQTMPWEVAPAQQNQTFELDGSGSSAPGGQGGSAEPWAIPRTNPDGSLASAPDLDPDNKRVDETALRYYARNGEIARVSAEIRRLQSLYPEWEPPEDIYDTDRVILDEQPLWDLFAAGKTQELYAKIREYVRENPGYRPSNELTRQIVLEDARRKIKTASDSKDYPAVIEVASRNPELLVCAEIDMIWRTAEALNKTGNTDQSLDAYYYILANCRNPAERRATVQKAAVLFPRPVVERMIEGNQGTLYGRSEFEGVALDLARSSIITSMNKKQVKPTQEDLDDVDTSARVNGNQADAELLGWYYFTRRDYPRALSYFQLSLDVGPSNKAIEGAVLSLREMGDLEAAENLAYQRASDDALIRTAYHQVMMLEIIEDPQTPIEGQRLFRFASSVNDARDADAAQILGWYFYEQDKLPEAGEWFDKSLDFEPNENAAIGAILVAQNTKQIKKRNALLAKYADDYASVAELEQLRVASAPVRASTRRSTRSSNSLVRNAQKEFKAGNYDTALTLLEQNAAKGREDRGAKMLRGWSLYHTNKNREAGKVFAEANKQRSTTSSRQGIWYSQKALYNYKDYDPQ